ncbi:MULTISPECIES: DUF6382 domain-containing protein [unclassified Paenibacillus]|uniref:DUF6382 domain-containing protein n=1 Tax=unclassified Paenibacillus TaxID=185978 RepID=UPI0009562990|nr:MULTISPECIES: DUF6382 domain-containing protein [unclassified Paenibacillus]ASS68861.1 FHA domain-containing protein [Paenibacillus sp. RUD330]SIR17636.1 FHA domain-containing protein [Paenibacillus sp. RU4X]SIR21227.1 FHA domain-containing protein [Paenibacillus sp. RU4T]
MGPLLADFEWNREHEMILSAEGGIGREELDEVELAMLESSIPPSLLPVEWQMWNGQVRFRYKLGGKKMLKHKLTEGAGDASQFYSLMLAVASICEECRSYMLKPENLVLDESCIFVGDSWGDIGLVYLPLVSPPQAVPPLRIRFLAMAARASASVQPDGRLASLMQAIGDDNVPMHDLRSLLLDAASLDEGACASMPSMPSIGVASSRSGAGEEGRFRSWPEQRDRQGSFAWSGTAAREPLCREDEKDLDLGQLLDRKDLFSGRRAGRDVAIVQAPDARASKGKDSIEADEACSLSIADSSRFKGQSKPNKGIVTLAVIAAAALPWKFMYMPDPGNRSLFLCCGTAAVAAGVLIWFWGRNGGIGVERVEEGDAEAEAGLLFVPDSGRLGSGRRWLSPTSDKPTDKPTDKPFAIPSDKPIDLPSKPKFLEQAFGNGLGSTFSEHAVQADRFSSHGVHGGDWSSHSHEASAAASPADKTVWLGAGGGTVAKEGNSSRHALLRSKDGSSEKLELSESRNQIGRAEGSVAVVDRSPGVSRIHLELEAGPSGCLAKDLGSRNGSLLNGRPMVPYKSYKLENGDVLQLAGIDGYSYEYAAPR